MFKLLGGIISLIVVYVIAIYFLRFGLGVQARSNLAVFMVLAGWYVVGIYQSRVIGSTGVLSNWVTPLSLFNLKLTSVAVLVLSASGYTFLTKSIAWDLAWAVTPIIPTGLIVLSLVPPFTSIPLRRTLWLLSCACLMGLMSLSVHIFDLKEEFIPLFEPHGLFNLYLVIFGHLAVVALTSLFVFTLRYYEFYQKRMATESKSASLTHGTKRQIAIHEAGHAIMYACYKQPPLVLNMVLYEQAMNIDESLLGVVQSRLSPPKSKNDHIWRMLMVLGGIRTELAINGKHLHGSTSDIEQWHRFAADYLTQYADKYTPQPETAAQMHHNKQLEGDLFEQHIKLVDKLISRNKGVIKSMASQAMAFHRLEREHMIVHLEKVRFPVGFIRL